MPVVKNPVTEVELAHRFARTPFIRFRLAGRGYETPRGKDPEWVNTDGATEWGRFFEKEEIREFAYALLEMVGER